ncbi:MAG: hypothetical protein OXI56_00755 [bacterium]|nr:hypothetical protein [bacterium]
MDLRGRWVRVRVVRGLAFAAVLAAVLAAALPAAVAQQDAPYGDIPSGAFYTEPVTTLAARGGGVCGY